MRTIIKGTQEFNVKELIITKNLWEYFILEEEDRPEDLPENIQMALVMGFETEIGDVDLEEIKPYVISKTTNLLEVMPPTGWAWKQ